MFSFNLVDYPMFSLFFNMLDLHPIQLEETGKVGYWATWCFCFTVRFCSNFVTVSNLPKFCFTVRFRSNFATVSNLPKFRFTVRFRYNFVTVSNPPVNIPDSLLPQVPVNIPDSLLPQVPINIPDSLLPQEPTPGQVPCFPPALQPV